MLSEVYLTGSEVLQLCNQTCYSSNVTLAATATQLMTYLAMQNDKGSVS